MCVELWPRKPSQSPDFLGICCIKSNICCFCFSIMVCFSAHSSRSNHPPETGVTLKSNDILRIDFNQMHISKTLENQIFLLI